MTALEHFGINIDAIKAKVETLFKDEDELVITRSETFSSDKECLITYKSANNDLPIDSVASALQSSLKIKIDKSSSSGEFLVIKRFQ